METIYETYIRTVCSNCKNKETDLCEIKRRRHDNTLYCENYDTTIKKEKQNSKK